MLLVPIRCTQNPTMGEEWRRGWHPERIAARRSDQQVLVVGGGPAGLECARGLGQRGYAVTLVEARKELGGRVNLESALPTLGDWRRVMDWRLTQIEKLENVALYPASPMTADDVLAAGFAHVLVATGATWRADGVGRHQWQPVTGFGSTTVFTPDDLMAGRLPQGRVVVYDDDHYYMGGILAELLVRAGCQVSLVTPASLVSYWTQNTLEQERIQARLMEMGVALHTQLRLNAVHGDEITFAHTASGGQQTLAADALVLVTDRLPNDALYQALKPVLAAGKLASLRVIGDAEAPHIIAQAIFSGHLAAQEFGEPVKGDATPFRVE